MLLMQTHLNSFILSLSDIFLNWKLLKQTMEVMNWKNPNPKPFCFEVGKTFPHIHNTDSKPKLSSSLKIQKNVGS